MAGPERLFRQTITYATETSLDAWGKPTLGASATAPARIQPEEKVYRDARGNEFISTHVIYTAAQLGTQHRVYLPGESVARRIQLVKPMVGGAGEERFRKVVLG